MEDELGDIYAEARAAAECVDLGAYSDPPVEIVTAFIVAGAIARHTDAVDRQTKAITKLAAVVNAVRSE